MRKLQIKFPMAGKFKTWSAFICSGKMTHAAKYLQSVQAKTTIMSCYNACFVFALVFKLLFPHRVLMSCFEFAMYFHPLFENYLQNLYFEPSSIHSSQCQTRDIFFIFFSSIFRTSPLTHISTSLTLLLIICVASFPFCSNHYCYHYQLQHFLTQAFPHSETW